MESDTLPKALVAFWWAPEIRRFESRSPLSAPPSVTPAAAAHIVRTNVSYVMEFLAWWVQKSKVFAQKSTAVKWNWCILWIDIEWGLQKLGLILESKVVQKLSLEKKNFNKEWSPRLIFLNKFFFEKIQLIFDIENWLWKYNFGTYWGPGTMSIYKIQQFHLNTTDFLAKSLLFRTHHTRNSMT